MQTKGIPRGDGGGVHPGLNKSGTNLDERKKLEKEGGHQIE